MNRLLPCVVLAVALLAADKPAEKKTDKERIQGTWVVASLEIDGNEVKDGPMFEALQKGKTTYKGDAYIPSIAPDGYTVTFALDPDKKPAALDLEVTYKGVKTVFADLYEFVDEDTLRVCASMKDATVRPKEFTSKDGQSIITYKREAPKPEK